MQRNLNNELALRRYGFEQIGLRAFSAGRHGLCGAVIHLERIGKKWEFAVYNCGQYDIYLIWPHSQSFASAENCIKAAVKYINGLTHKSYDIEPETNTQLERQYTMVNANNTELKIAPGRYFLLRVDGDGRWTGRWVSEVTASVKEDMKNGQYSLYDFALPDGEDLADGNLGIRELADMRNRKDGFWVKLVAARREEYRKHNKLA